MIVLFILGMCTISTSVLSAQVIEGVDYSDRSHVYQTFDLTTNDEVGQRFASESLTYVDDVTGFEILSLTTSRFSNSSYFTRNDIKLMPLHPNKDSN